LLRARGLDFEETDITLSQARTLEMIERSGKQTVPQVFIDGQYVGGFDELADLDLPARPGSQ
jgi:glutaredoxin 3